MNKKVLYILGKFQSGGIESVFNPMICNISKENLQIDLVTNILDKKLKI